ncbi:MAG: hypothetical protein VKK97_00115 [Synechococcaceae cyanobacterium]|nr:hypothetical protein [Synechococcaceae cyanobacterium]
MEDAEDGWAEEGWAEEGKSWNCAVALSTAGSGAENDRKDQLFWTETSFPIERYREWGALTPEADREQSLEPGISSAFSS